MKNLNEMSHEEEKELITNLGNELSKHDIEAVITSINKDKTPFELPPLTFYATYDIETGKALFKYNEHLNHIICLDGYGSYIVAYNMDDVVKFYNSKSAYPLEITIPPLEDIDDNGNYIGNDPKFIKN